MASSQLSDETQVSLLTIDHSLNNGSDKSGRSDQEILNESEITKITPQYHLRSGSKSAVITESQGEEKICSNRSKHKNPPDTQAKEGDTTQDIINSINKSIHTVSTTLEANLERSHSYLNDLLVKQNVNIQQQATQTFQQIQELTNAMSLMSQTIPKIQDNTKNILELKQQLNSLQDTIQTLHTPQTNKPVQQTTLDEQQQPPPLQIFSAHDYSTQIKSPSTLKLAQEIGIPKFDGLHELPSIFLKKLNKYFLLANVDSDAHKLSYFEHGLSGKAAAWFQANEYSFVTWPQTQEAFLSYFQGPYHLEQQKRTWDRYFLSQKDDVQEFILDSINFLKVLHPNATFREISELIIHKLPRQLRKPLRESHMKLDSPTLLLQAVSQITHMEELEEEDDMHNKQNYLRDRPQPSYHKAAQPPQRIETQPQNTHYRQNSRSVNAVGKPQRATTSRPQNNHTSFNPHTTQNNPRNRAYYNSQGNENRSG